MSDRQNISSGTQWEPLVGYSRAVRVGNLVFVAGTTGIGESGIVVGDGDPHLQTVQAIRNIETALHKAGATLQHVVRTRIFVRDIHHWTEIGRAHGQFFGEIRPASSMIEVNRFIDPLMLVEIEADAVIES